MLASPLATHGQDASSLYNLKLVAAPSLFARQRAHCSGDVAGDLDSSGAGVQCEMRQKKGDFDISSVWAHAVTAAPFSDQTVRMPLEMWQTKRDRTKRGIVEIETCLF